MPDLLAASIEFGGYISIIKLVIFLVLFFPLLPILCWIYNDAEILENRSNFWITIILAIAGAAILIWLLVPFFIIGLFFYTAGVGLTAMAYVKNRNSLVMESEKVLTADHIKGLLTGGKDKELKGDKKFIFITANKNEVPIPEPKTPDYHGYKIAYQLFDDAIWRRVSSIIFMPGADVYNYVYYIDGIAIKQPPMAKDQADFFIRFVKQLCNLDINEKRKPQKGKFKMMDN